MRSVRTLLTALAALACTAPAAGAAVPGVNLGTEAVPGRWAGIIEGVDVQAAKDRLGARSVRIFVDWADTQPSAGAPLPERIAALRDAVDTARRLGMTPVLVVLHAPAWASGTSDRRFPPSNPATYAGFVGSLAATLRGPSGPHPVFEIWNEMDESHFWAPAPDASAYTRLLRPAYAAIKAQDPNATVLFGALTGNNYDFLGKAYAAGAKGAFDGVAVHTDTACLVNPPDVFLRNMGRGLDGRINQYSFLGFREVRAEMERHGDAKPIYMTELGWSTHTGDCEVSSEPGRLGGVPAEQAAANLRQAYACLARPEYHYVEHALYFDFKDRGAARPHRYGLFDVNGAPKPAAGAFQAVTGGQVPPAAACGDFSPPEVTQLLPAREFTGTLQIRAKAVDASGVVRITLIANGRVIRSWGADDVRDGKLIDDEWWGAKKLPYGTHTIRLEAVDPMGNVGATELQVTKHDPAKLRSTVPTSTRIASVAVRRGRATLVAYVQKASPLSLGGKVQVFWQARRPVRGKLRWKKVHGGLRTVRITGTGTHGRVVFHQALRFPRYRVKLRYLGEAPFRPSWSAFRSVR